MKKYMYQALITLLVFFSFSTISQASSNYPNSYKDFTNVMCYSEISIFEKFEPERRKDIHKLSDKNSEDLISKVLKDLLDCVYGFKYVNQLFDGNSDFNTNKLSSLTISSTNAKNLMKAVGRHPLALSSTKDDHDSYSTTKSIPLIPSISCTINGSIMADVEPTSSCVVKF